MSEKLYKLNKYLVIVFILSLVPVTLDMLIESVDIISHFFGVYILILIITMTLFFVVPVLRIALFLIKTDHRSRYKKFVSFLGSFFIFSVLGCLNILPDNDFPIFTGIIWGVVVTFHEVLFNKPSKINKPIY